MFLVLLYLVGRFISFLWKKSNFAKCGFQDCYVYVYSSQILRCCPCLISWWFCLRGIIKCPMMENSLRKKRKLVVKECFVLQRVWWYPGTLLATTQRLNFLPILSILAGTSAHIYPTELAQVLARAILLLLPFYTSFLQTCRVSTFIHVLPACCSRLYSSFSSSACHTSNFCSIWS